MFKMRTRGALKDLQSSATDKGVLVGSPARMTPPAKNIQISEKCFKAFKDKSKMTKAVEKENRRTDKASKRKTGKSEKLTSMKSSLKMKKDIASAQPKLNIAPASNYSEKLLKVKKDLTSANIKSDTVLAGNSTEKNSLQFSSLDDNELTKFDIANVTVDQNVSDIIPLVTSVSDSYSHSYWQDLAEQRRIALDKALLENEQLFDQVTVLQAENSLLKDALESAEKLLKMEGLLE